MKAILICAALIAVPAFAQSGATTSSQGAFTPTDAAPAPAPTLLSQVKIAQAEPEALSEKLICKKQEVIGSLIAKKRVCATAANWARNEVNAKDHLKILTEPGAFAPSR